MSRSGVSTVNSQVLDHRFVDVHFELLDSVLNERGRLRAEASFYKDLAASLEAQVNARQDTGVQAQEQTNTHLAEAEERADTAEKKLAEAQALFAEFQATHEKATAELDATKNDLKQTRRERTEQQKLREAAEAEQANLAQITEKTRSQLAAAEKELDVQAAKSAELDELVGKLRTALKAERLKIQTLEQGQAQAVEKAVADLKEKNGKLIAENVHQADTITQLEAENDALKAKLAAPVAPQVTLSPKQTTILALLKRADKQWGEDPEKSLHNLHRVIDELEGRAEA